MTENRTLVKTRARADDATCSIIMSGTPQTTTQHPLPTDAQRAAASLARITQAEHEVILVLVSTCSTDKAIANVLGRSPKTVRRQMDSAMTKLEVNTRTGLVVEALRLGLAELLHDAPRTPLHV
jgi:DNA-binding NarL/FixJ family response regulator